MLLWCQDPPAKVEAFLWQINYSQDRQLIQLSKDERQQPELLVFREGISGHFMSVIQCSELVI